MKQKGEGEARRGGKRGKERVVGVWGRRGRREGRVEERRE